MLASCTFGTSGDACCEVVLSTTLDVSGTVCIGGLSFTREIHVPSRSLRSDSGDGGRACGTGANPTLSSKQLGQDTCCTGGLMRTHDSFKV